MPSIQKFKNCFYDALSDTGLVRSENQDSFGIFEKPGEFQIFVVCDGMGGVKGGKVASSLSIAALKDQIARKEFVFSKEGICSVIQKANQVVYNKSASETSLRGMGTTLVLLAHSASQSFVAHVGDSRLYRVFQDEISILTKDHTFAQELIDSGATNQSGIRKSPISHLLTRAIGIQKTVEVEVSDIQNWRGEDLFLLSSDGLYNHLNNDKILSLAKKSRVRGFYDLVSFSKFLVSEAIERGGSDNITVLPISYLAKEDTQVNSFILEDENGLRSFISQVDLDFSLDGLEKSTSAKDSAVNLPWVIMALLAGIGLFLFYLLPSGSEALWAGGGNLAASKQIVDYSKVKEISPILSSFLSSKQLSREESLQGRNFSFVFFDYQDMVDNKDLSVGLVQKKSKEILNILESPSFASFLSDVQFPDQPIDWGDEEEKLKRLKGTGQELPEKSISKEELESTRDKKIDVREKIFDLDQKIELLSIWEDSEQGSGKERQANLLSKLENDKKSVEDDLRQVEQHIRETENLIKSFRANFGSVSADNLTRVLSLFEAIDPEIYFIKREYLEQEKLTSFYSKLLVQSESHTEVASLLSSSIRDKSRLEDKLRAKIDVLFVKGTEEIENHLAMMKWLESIMKIESQRFARKQGFVESDTELSDLRRNDLILEMASKRNKLTSEFEELEKILSWEQEMELGIKELSSSQHSKS